MLASCVAAALVGVVIMRGVERENEVRLDAGCDESRAGPAEAGPYESTAGHDESRAGRDDNMEAGSGSGGHRARPVRLRLARPRDWCWTRILALVLGPTTYAFAATLAAVVAGVAIGSGAGTWLFGRMKAGAHAGWLALILAVGAVTIVGTSFLAGGYVPLAIAREMAAAPDSFSALVSRGMLLTALLVLPTAICLGAAFPLALSMAGDHERSPARRFGVVYAVNTIGARSPARSRRASCSSPGSACRRRWQWRPSCWWPPPLR